MNNEACKPNSPGPERRGGLGLATVYGIVKQHQGWIEVESQVGVGTVFKVFFPAVTQPAIATENKIDTAFAKRGHETILLVEDEGQLRALMRSVLERQGYRVIEAVSGVDALAQWEQRGAGVELIDVGDGGRKPAFRAAIAFLALRRWRCRTILFSRIVVEKASWLRYRGFHMNAKWSLGTLIHSPG